MKIILLGALLLGFSLDGFAKQEELVQREYVVLLHGLHRSSLSMKKLEKGLQQAGYRTININYPSTNKTISELVDFIHPKIEGIKMYDPKAIHFVGHSMGNLLIRGYINKYRPKRVGKVVMLAPPNQGSEIADHLQDKKFYQWIFGPSLQELGTDQQKISMLLGEINYPVGIIAGDRSINPLFSKYLEKPHDGTVSYKRTSLPEQTDQIILHVSHSLIMFNKQAIQQTIYFLKNNKFSHLE